MINRFALGCKGKMSTGDMFSLFTEQFYFLRDVLAIKVSSYDPIFGANYYSN